MVDCTACELHSAHGVFNKSGAHILKILPLPVLRNMWPISFTFSTFPVHKSPLKDFAPLNIKPIPTAWETFHRERSLLTVLCLKKACEKSGNGGSKHQSLIGPYSVVLPAMTWSLVSMQGYITDSNLRSTQDSSQRRWWVYSPVPAHPAARATVGPWPWPWPWQSPIKKDAMSNLHHLFAYYAGVF